MPTNTSRLSLVIPASTDNESTFPSQATTTYNILDNATLVTEGTLASRPLATSVEKDHIYKATDTVQWFISDGTNWNVVQVSNAWTALTLASGVIAASGEYVPSVRLEGDVVRLKGAMQNNTGGNITAGATWATIPASPAGLRPTVGTNLVIPAALSTSTLATNFGIGNNGLIWLTQALGNGAQVYLDGVTFTTS